MTNKGTLKKLFHVSEKPSDVDVSARFMSVFFGMAIMKHTKQNGKTVPTEENLYSWNSVNLIAMMVSMSLALYIIIDYDQTDVNVSRITFNLQYIILVVGAILTMSICFFNRTYFVQMMRVLDQVDDDFKKIGETFSLAGFYWFVKTGWCIILFAVISFDTTDLAKSELLRRRSKIISYGFSVTIIIMFSLQFHFSLWFIWQRFMRVNHCLQNLERYTSNIRKSMLQLFMSIHFDLCRAAKLGNKYGSIQVLITIYINFIGTVWTLDYLLTLDPHVDLTLTDGLLWAIYYTGSLVFGYIIPTLVQYEANRTARILGNLQSCYFDDKLSKTRNTFLLQTMHQRVNLHAGKLHPLHISMLKEQFGMIITNMLFLSQARNYNRAIEKYGNTTVS